MCPVPSFALGAWLDMTGTLAPSQRGEMTLWATGVCVVQEPTRPLEMLTSHGRVPPEQRFVTHPEQVALLRRRSTLLRSLRQSLWTESFEETETPILHRFASGAAAQPSTTYSRASEAELSLRIAPEPHLIRLMAAGFPRIFEVARSFRNEGFSARHHPEFTLLEVYEAGASLSRSITHCGELFTSSFAALGLNPSVVSFRGNILNFSSPRIVDLRVLVEEQTACQSVDDCVSFLLEQGVTPPPWNLWKLGLLFLSMRWRKGLFSQHSLRDIQQVSARLPYPWITLGQNGLSFLQVAWSWTMDLSKTGTALFRKKGFVLRLYAGTVMTSCLQTKSISSPWAGGCLPFLVLA